MLSTSPAQTRAIGEALSQRLQAGDVLLLTGDLGAGKSELTRGIAEGLGLTGPFPSPTFTILNVYEDGRIPLYHFDFYRLSSSEEIYEMGLDEWIGGDGIAVIEWPSQCPEVLPDTCLEIRLEVLGETERRLTFLPRGNFRDVTEEQDI